MSLRNILKFAALGALVYGAYKLGESQGQKEKPANPEKKKDYIDIVDDIIKRNQMAFNEQVDYIRQLISELRDKPNKTIQERNNLNKLNKKLDELTKK